MSCTHNQEHCSIPLLTIEPLCKLVFIATGNYYVKCFEFLICKHPRLLFNNDISNQLNPNMCEQLWISFFIVFESSCD